MMNTPGAPMRNAWLFLRRLEKYAESAISAITSPTLLSMKANMSAPMTWDASRCAWHAIEKSRRIYLKLWQHSQGQLMRWGNHAKRHNYSAHRKPGLNVWVPFRYPVTSL